MSGYLLDTNCISEAIRPQLNRGVESWLGKVHVDTLYVSVLTLGEVRNGITRLAHGRRRTQLEQWLEVDLRERFEGRILAVTESIADKWGALAGEVRLRGVTLPVVDGILAATAIEYNLTVVTRNSRDFQSSHVPVFNPWT